MTDAIEPLSQAARMSDDEWPGVVAAVSPGVRVVVNAKGTRYSVQRAFSHEGKPTWAGRSYATLSKLLAKQGDVIDGLAVACEGLPDDPALVSPELQGRRRRLLEAFEVSDWSASEYPRVVWDEGNARVIVSPCGTQYIAQYVLVEDGVARRCMPWRRGVTAASKTELLRLMRWLFFDITDERRLRGDYLERALAALPEMACDGRWPPMAERPPTRRYDAQGRRKPE